MGKQVYNKTFSPEFLNRLDEIITFNQLDSKSLRKIVDIELKLLVERVLSLGYHLEVSDKACDFLASKGYDVQFGARPLKRAIQSYLEDTLSEFILTHSLKPGISLLVEVNEVNDALVICQKKNSQSSFFPNSDKMSAYTMLAFFLCVYP